MDAVPASAVPPLVPPARASQRRHAATLKLLLIALLVILLQIPTYLVNNLREERHHNREQAVQARTRDPERLNAALEGYRLTERALKHSVLILALVFAAYFLFEMVAGLRLHAVHYCLVGAALCLFYLALLALGEVMPPGYAYLGAAAGSSLLITFYSAAILQSRERAAIVALLLAAVFGALYVVLRMEDYALLAGTAALFAALGAVMYFTRHVDWQAHDAAPGRP